jgi:hypothetical protein
LQNSAQTTLSINDTPHYNTDILLSVVRYNDCHVSFNVMLNVYLLSVIMLNVIMLTVVLLTVAAASDKVQILIPFENFK